MNPFLGKLKSKAREIFAPKRPLIVETVQETWTFYGDHSATRQHVEFPEDPNLLLAVSLHTRMRLQR